MQAQQWVAQALAMTPPGVFAWRADMFAQMAVAEGLNRTLNEVWNDQGNNLSVPLSSNGATPITHFAGSGAIDTKLLDGLCRALERHRGAFALIKDDVAGRVLTVLGSDGPALAGQSGHFWDLAPMLGLRRIDTPLPELLPSALGGSLLLQSIVVPTGVTQEGECIRVLAIPWLAIAEAIARDPAFLSYFAKQPRKFEEFLAGTYERAGFDEVILTPRSGDGGRDVIATKHGFCSIRILDQAKAYSPGHVVTNNDVRAMAGVMWNDRSASKAAVTTTSDFAPSVFEEYKASIPTKLELRSGDDLRRLIADLRTK